MTRQTTPVHYLPVSLAGVPLAAEWVGHFAVIHPATARPDSRREKLVVLGRRLFGHILRRRPYRSLHPVGDSAAWSPLAAVLITAHECRLAGSGSEQTLVELDSQIAKVVEKTDATVAQLTGLAPEDIGLGVLLSELAARWVIHAASPEAETSYMGMLHAQRDYRLQLQRLAENAE